MAACGQELGVHDVEEGQPGIALQRQVDGVGDRRPALGTAPDGTDNVFHSL